LQEYPWAADGLALSERRVLLAVQAGAATQHEVFRRVWRRERRPYLGDTSCFAIIRRLAEAAHPLLDTRHGVRLTPTGEDVLAARADFARLNGLDRWLGGVHLTGAEPAWRYDERLERLSGVQPAAA